MAETKKEPDYNEASSRLSESSISLEEAETDIKELAKKAVLNDEPEALFLMKVEETLKKRLARVRSPTLVQKSFIALWRLAQKTYREEKELMDLRVRWFFMIREAKAQGKPQAGRLYRSTVEEFGTIMTSVAFIKATTGGSLPPPPPITITSEEMEEDPERSIDSYNTALPLDEYHNTYLQRVEKVKQSLITSSAEVNDSLTLRNLAEMTVRYEHQKQMIDDLKQNDVTLVYIEPHSNCSKRCEKYQVGGSSHPSGLYSLDGSTGTTAEGVKYVPLTFATNNPVDRYVTQKGDVYQNGCILGYNCRHRLVPYKPHNQPIPIPASVIKKTREIEQRQREMEREIRYLRGAELQATTKEERAKYKKLVERAEQEYKTYSSDNKMTYFIRRTEIF